MVLFLCGNSCALLQLHLHNKDFIWRTSFAFIILLRVWCYNYNIKSTCLWNDMHYYFVVHVIYLLFMFGSHWGISYIWLAYLQMAVILHFYYRRHVHVSTSTSGLQEITCPYKINPRLLLCSCYMSCWFAVLLYIDAAHGWFVFSVIDHITKIAFTLIVWI